MYDLVETLTGKELSVYNTEENAAMTKRWIWKMDWCKERGVSPYNFACWDMAEKAYLEKEK